MDEFKDEWLIAAIETHWRAFGSPCREQNEKEPVKEWSKSCNITVVVK